ncbi:MAG: crossover junction endodeoxyribonuclease RuvC [Candidatus Zixiibacteriota bacterium]
MRILGIDPGLNITGYAVIEDNCDTITVQEAGIVRTDGSDPMETRLHHIGQELEAIIDQFRPDAVAVEELYSHYNHPRTAIIMGHARGIVFLKAAQFGVKVFPYASTKVKNALTGNGRASKRQVQQMIASTLCLGAIPEPPDVADALAVALCHMRMLRHQQMSAV